VSLRRMVLRDFVIVSELELELAPRFTVLTGETGAGKSILIDALQLVTGGRADSSMIREGAARTDVSAEFDLPADLLDWLDEAGLLEAAPDPGAGLLLRRSVDLQGKSRAWINGTAATASQLRAVGERLLDIHGQHAWQSLTRAETMRALLDAYAQVTSGRVAELWRQWRTAQQQLVSATDAEQGLAARREQLAWQLGELDKLAPRAQEWPGLQAEHTRLSHAHTLLESAQAALLVLDGEERGVLSELGKAHDLLQKHEHIEPEFTALAEQMASSLVQLEDAARSVRGYLRHTELDPQTLAAVDARMGQWIALARRHRCAPEQLPGLHDQLRLELTELERTGDLQALEQALQAAWQAYLQEAQSLSRQRSSAAQRLAHSITAAMQGLGMKGGQFLVQIEASAQALQSGMDEVVFLVAGHAGSTPRPIGKVASGGELSRIALAIAVTTSQLGSAQTLIFDEVDAGVGGAVAQTVGQLMRRLGQDRQVLAVTHLPQVAACANQHLVVSKHTVDGATVSRVQDVQGAQRVQELARMLGGERILDSTLAHARDMLQTVEV